MNILCIGDVFGEAGCDALRKRLPLFKKQNNIDMVIANGENSAAGNGITPDSARFLLNCGVDIITGGNHSLRRKEIFDMLEDSSVILRPENMGGDLAGGGFGIVDFGHTRVAVINLLGSVYLEAAENPFLCAERLVGKAKEQGINIIIVDFHAEVTSEKRAMGFFLDGKVSAVFGTHTHVTTADEQILPAKTGYITDLGMSGVEESVLGVKKEIIIDRLKNGGCERFLPAEGECSINGCIFSVEKSTGKCNSVKRVKF